MSEATFAPSFEQRIRDRAYLMWENEGRPFGRDVEHWRLSEEATRAETAEPAPSAKPVRAKKAAAPKKAAASKRPAIAAGVSAAL